MPHSFIVVGYFYYLTRGWLEMNEKADFTDEVCLSILASTLPLNLRPYI